MWHKLKHNTSQEPKQKGNVKHYIQDRLMLQVTATRLYTYFLYNQEGEILKKK